MPTTSTTTDTSPPRQSMRPWLRLLFAPTGDGVRRRNGSDVARLVSALLLVLIVGYALSPDASFQKHVTNVVHPPPHGLSWLFTLLWALGTIGVLIGAVVVTLVLRRMEVLRDLAVGAALAIVACIAVQQLFGTSAGVNQHDAVGVNVGYPVPILAAAVAAALTLRPYLSRGLQRLLEALLAVAVVGGLIHGSGLLFSLASSLVLGWGAAAAAHLIFGTPTGVLPAGDVEALLKELDVDATGVVASPLQTWGVARYIGTSATHGDLDISVYGRDAEQSQLFAKIGRTLILKRDSGPFALTRAQQLEHESYLTLQAATVAPGRTSAMVSAGYAGTARDAIVVTARPPGKLLDAVVETKERVSDAAMKAVAGAVASLHEAKVSHGAIDLHHVVVSADDGALIEFDRATAFAQEDALNRDTAALLVTLALVSSTDRSVEIVKGALGTERLAASLGFLQDAAISDPLATSIRRMTGKAILKELREKGAAAVGVEAPELVEMHRASATTLILAVGTLIGGWALIEVLLQVAGSFSTVKSASIPWVIATAIISQLTYFSSSFSTLGSITMSVPLFPLVMLELSNTFSGLALGTPAVLAARVRFFQKHGMDTTIAVSSGVLVSTASWIVKGGLFLISIPFALGALHFGDLLDKKSSGSSSSNLLIFVLVAVVAIGIVIAVVLFVPRWRRMVKAKIAPRLTEVLSHFKVLAGSPAKIVEIFGGQLGAQLFVAFALGTSLRAYHHSLSLPVLLVVLTLGSMLGGVSPVPGGMGVVEAGMILGLKAAGIPSDVAVSAVFVQRLFTAYLPPIAGWFALMWLRRKKYL
jgi:uncharacterized membrane protein YbhN (UPF0104 family)